MKVCARCKQSEDVVVFNKNKTYCKECVRYHNQKQALKKGIVPKFIPVLTDTHKQCGICKELKSLDNFTYSPRGRMKKSSYCKPCISKYQLSKISKEERRLKTQKYRDENREWWRSLHRINQFNRRAKIKLVSDGSVTPEFVVSIYSICNCYYCNDFTSEKFRTLEHKHPLNKGGLHSSNNITMACLKCNSTKRDMTETQFKNYLNEQDKC